MERLASLSPTQRYTLRLLGFALLIGAALMFRPTQASAHCDTMDGPVVSAARTALSSGNVNQILVWVKKEDEEKIRRLFARTRRKRAAGGKAAEKADMELFNELVRIHREGEGAKFTGLKPAGQVEPSIATLDRSLTAASPEELRELFTKHLAKRLDDGVEELVMLRKYDTDDVAAGRKYVEEYVGFAHYVEALEQLIHGSMSHDAHAKRDADIDTEDSHGSSHAVRSEAANTHMQHAQEQHSSHHSR